MPSTLTLEVTGRQAAQFGSRARKVFEGKGGSIGRSEDCDWVLSASGVSRVHAMIRLLNGLYFIEDRSANGVLLNGTPLMRGDPSPLKDGDRLLIDSFEIECRLADGSAALVDDLELSSPHRTVPSAPPAVPGSSSAEDPFDFAMFDAPLRSSAVPQPPLADSRSGSLLDNDLIPDVSAASTSNDLDPLSFLGSPDGIGSPPRGTPHGGLAEDWNHSSGPTDHFRPPAALPPSVEHRQPRTLPENWDLTMGDFAPKTPQSRQMPPPAVAEQAAAASRSVPIQPVVPSVPNPSSGLPPDAERIFRVVVDGVMDVLRARAEIKNTFRLPVTIIQRSENNPLKFAPTADEALQKILGPQSSAFLSGTAAFEDAFDDIRCHQMAMLAGVRAAFESLLVYFSPERFEHDVDGGSKRPGFMDFAAGKGRYWEKYRENFEGLNRDPDGAFRRLFGDEFARAYEEQLSRLKSARRMQQSKQR